MLKLDLHTHTGDDPCDHVAHTTRQLIDHASRLGFGALAITLHDRYFDPSADQAYAKARGLLLLAGVERTIERRHVLLVNFPAEAAAVTTFPALERLRQDHPHGLVVAPHPFYPIASAMAPDLERWGGLVDAVEINSVYTRGLNFNRRAERWARANGKPLVGNTDLHLLDQLGTTYSLVEAEATPDAICEAIRGGRVEVRSDPLPPFRAGWVMARMLAGGAVGKLKALTASR